ncbi:MAG: type II toxin-antitoxin system VapC family toxin [Betaproteobacteria bacterium]|nr:type II toxin-antitoxin system VapC family toxin [Betaproteobacteria bacterium]
MLVLLDTDICICLINRRPGFERVLRRISGRSHGEICISAIAVSELRFGVANSAHASENRIALEEFLSRFELLDYPVEASVHYGSIRRDLQRAGTPIGNNDLLIASHAMAIKANVATANVAEFRRVKGLKVVDWLG